MFWIGNFLMESMKENLLQGGTLFHLPPSLKLLPQPLRELSSHLSVRISAVPGIENHGCSQWVLGLRSGKCWKHGPIAPFIKMKKGKITDLQRLYWYSPCTCIGFTFLPTRIQLYYELKQLSPQMPHRALILCHACKRGRNFFIIYKFVKFSI